MVIDNSFRHLPEQSDGQSGFRLKTSVDTYPIYDCLSYVPNSSNFPLSLAFIANFSFITKHLTGLENIMGVEQNNSPHKT